MIYYVFLKETGEYMGAGTPYYEDETYGCTTVPSIDYNSENEKLFWNAETETWYTVAN
jgi:hypothetical protein